MLIIGSMDMGGAEMLAARLAEELNRSLLFSVSVCALEDRGELRKILMANGTPHLSLGKKPGKDFSIPAKIARRARDERIDIIHTHGQGPLLYACLAKLFYRENLLVHSEHIKFEVETSSPKKIFLYNSVLYRFIDSFLSITAHLEQYYSTKFPFLKGKITTITNGINIDQFNEKDEKIVDSARESYHVAKNAKIIGNISVLRDQKDHASLIRAMQTVIHHVPEAVLVIAGDGPLRDKLERLTYELAIQDSIMFLGYRKDVATLLRTFDVFALTSLFEGLSLCLLEAAASGTPIVATDVEGNNELITNNVNGLLAPAKSPEEIGFKIVELLTNIELAKDLSERGKQIVFEKFNQATMVKRYMQFYSSMMERKNVS